MMQIAIHGRLGADPKRISTQTGKPMASCSVAVEVAGKDDQKHTEWFSIVAFGRHAETLLRHRKGDAVSAAGRVQISTYRKDGQDRRGRDIVVDSLVSVSSVIPVEQSRDFDDSVAF